MYGSMYTILKNQFTKRDLKRKTKDKFDQNLHRLYRKEKKLNEQWDNLPMIELEKPYQKGYKRFFILRDDVARSPQADYFQVLLDKINTVQFHHEKKFKEKKRKNRKRIYVDKIQNLENISIYDFLSNSKKVWTDKERLYFELRDVYYSINNSWRREYVFTEPWRYVLKVKAHVITHVKQTDEELDAEIGELKRHIENRFLYHKIWKLKSSKASFKGYGISEGDHKEKIWFKTRGSQNDFDFLKDNY
jgi:hypothetical protein